ncbi:LysR family transcriptional regulator, partial [Pseudomonas helleri]
MQVGKATGRELGQTQSSISKRIASLEQQLGGRLF